MPAFDDLEVDEACETILGHLARSFERQLVHVSLDEARGRVLAEDIIAPHSSPREARSVMDGYAICPGDAPPSPRRFAVVGESAAGRLFAAGLGVGDAVRISTGAVVPPDATVVVAQEDARREGDDIFVADPAVLRPGRFIRTAGSDWDAGSLRLPRGSELGPAELAMLIALERSAVPVFKRPSVAIISTGDELLAPAEPYREGAVRSSNGPMLAHQAITAGGEVTTNVVVPDESAPLVTALHAASEANLILTSGGVSVGDHDHIHAGLQECGAAVLFRRVRMRPGRPVTIACMGDSLICALPGNPASSWATFELLARPALRFMAGIPNARCPRLRLQVPVAAQLSPLHTRDHFMRAIIRDGLAHPLPQQASGNLSSLTGVDGMIRVPAGTEDIPAHTPLWIYLIKP